jgi:predicted porin
VDSEGDSQKLVYITPNFAGFQVRLSYTPNNNAEDYTAGGVNGHGTPAIFPGTAHHTAGFYATYDYAGDGWGVDWGGGIDHMFAIRSCAGTDVCRRSTTYQTGLNVNFGGFGIGVVTEYFGNGGDDNNAWIIGGGLSYGVDAWTVGLQGSHGFYNAANGGGGDGGHDTLNRVIATGAYAMAPGVTLDAELGYTWFHDTSNGATNATDRYHAFDIQIGSALTF